jgi:Domain of unknown function (DUF4349)/Putative zinc-finger
MNRPTQHAFDPEEVMAYLDGELEPQRAAALAGHLEHCEGCHAVAKQFRQLSERLIEFQIEDPPHDVSTGVLAGLESSKPPKKSAPSEIDEVIWGKLRRTLRSSAAWALAAAAVIVLVLIGVHESAPEHPVAFDRVELEAKSSTGGSTVPAETRDDFPASMRSPSISKLQAAPNAKAMIAGGGGDAGSGAIKAPAPTGPMIAQTASLTIVASSYNEASAAVDRLAASQDGYVQKLATQDQLAAARQFTATVRVPAAQLGGFLAELRKLGHVEQETRTNEEVTDQYVDLQARLRSARASEQRMLELLATRTGKLEDVLDAERELARIREEIESMEGQRILLAHRVNFATVEIQLREEYREKLDSRSSSTATKIWNAAVEGYGNLEDGVIGVLLFLLSYGPAILFWLTVVLVPSWFVWRRFRSRT